MILLCESHVAYIVEPKSRRRTGGYHYLGNRTGTQFNGPIYVPDKIIKAVMISVTEAEVDRLYMNAAQEAFPMRTTLEKLDHPQATTSMRTDESTKHVITNK